jgi:ATP-dependent Lon protease
VLAAHRAGIKRVIVPERNRNDLEDVPKDVKDEMEFVFVSQMNQVIEAALEEQPVAHRAPPPLDGGTAAAAPLAN